MSASTEQNKLAKLLIAEGGLLTSMMRVVEALYHDIPKPSIELAIKLIKDVEEINDNPPNSLMSNIRFTPDGKTLAFDVHIKNYDGMKINLGNYTVTFHRDFPRFPRVTGGNYSYGGSNHPHVSESGESFCLGDYSTATMIRQMLTDGEVEPTVTLLSNILNTYGDNPYVSIDDLMYGNDDDEDTESSFVGICRDCDCSIYDNQTYKQLPSGLYVCEACSWVCGKCYNRFPVWNGSRRLNRYRVRLSLSDNPICSDCFHKYKFMVPVKNEKGVITFVSNRKVRIKGRGDRIEYEVKK